MQAVLIQSTDGTQPTFLSISVARYQGAAIAWTHETQHATAFARRKDAEAFAQTFLPFVWPDVGYLTCEIEE